MIGCIHRWKKWSAGTSIGAVLIMSGIMASVAGATPEPSGLAGHYSFDEGSGTVLHDSAGNDDSGTVYNGSWVTVAGGNKALSFNGSSTYVDCGPRSELQSVGTICVWVKPAAGCTGGLVGWWNGATLPAQRAVLAFNSTTGAIQFYLANGTTYQKACESALPTLDEWSHLAVTFDGEVVKVYRNGVQADSALQAVIPSLLGISVRFGRSSGLGLSYFSGLMDEVRIYNRALYASEIEGIYTQGAFSYGHVTKLNNLCGEVLNVTPGTNWPASYSFTNPRDGWVYFITEATGTLTLTVPGAQPATIRDASHGTRHEAMRWLPLGTQTVNIAGSGSLDRLIARSVASATFYQYEGTVGSPGTAPSVPEFGAYDWDFLKRSMLDQVNMIYCHWLPDVAQEWYDRGGRWLDDETRIETVSSSTDVYNYLTSQPGLTDSRMHGVIIDEFQDTDSGTMMGYWQAAARQILNEPAYAGRMVVPWMAGAGMNSNLGAFARTVAAFDSYFSWESYLMEQATASEAQTLIQNSLAGLVPGFEKEVPAAVTKLVMTLSYMSVPPKGHNNSPAANFQVFLDMQYHHLATDPNFVGLAGINQYKSYYCDEETVRYAAKLYRHYILEGSTERLTSDSGYALSYIQNSDFVSGTAGWTLTPAPGKTISQGSWPNPTEPYGYGYLTGRWATGNTFLITERSSSGPNKFSQTLCGLTAGKYYSLKMIVGDYDDLLAGSSQSEQYGVEIKIDNASVVNAFAHVYPQADNRLWAFNDNPYWMNFHWRVFKALGTTATLTVSDWAGPAWPGGAIGQRLAFNFIEIQPYSGFELPGGGEAVPTLHVQTTPIAGAAITGSISGWEGTSNYSAEAENNARITLTAPASVVQRGTSYGFARWELTSDASNLVAHYPLDEMSGLVAHDVSGNGNHGTIRGAAWSQVNGRYGLAFNGTGNYVDCGGAAAFDQTGPVTLSAWVCPDAGGSGLCAIAGKGLSCYLLDYDAGYNARFHVADGSNSAYGRIPTGVWTHVAGTFDGTTVRLYVNGQLANERASSYATIATGVNFFIGKQTDGGYFKGKIADVKLYNRALSATEIQEQWGVDQALGERTISFNIRSAVTAIAKYTAPITTVHGTVVPQGYLGDITLVGLRFEFRSRTGGDTVTRSAFLGSGGGFAFNNIPAGLYDIAVKSYAHLQKVLPNVEVSGSPIDLGNINLIAGDIDGDNGVGLSDVVIWTANCDDAGDKSLKSD